MDYKKAYEESMFRMKKWTEGSDVIEPQEVAEFVFPELKESKDEKIRKDLIEFVNQYGDKFYGTIAKASALSWLEKQGEKEFDPRYENLKEILAADDIYQMSMNDEMVQEAKEKAVNALSGMCIGRLLGLEKQGKNNMGISEATKKKLEDNLNKALEKETPESWNVFLEKQGEQKPTEWHREDEQNLNACLGYISDEFLRRWLRDIIDVKYNKPVDKVKLKFKVGDWIIRSAEDFKHNTYLVTEVKDYYICEDLKGRRVTFTFNDVHKNFKLWDISDAKDGDVLSFDNECSNYHSIGIFKRIASKNEPNGNTYRCYVRYGGFKEELEIPVNGDELHHCGTSAHPATKEQCNKLEKAITEAGYEWDSEKKELKKIDESWYDVVH